ncbi:hypothetical protein ALC56_04381 [Trachymyrmex septentrionalis]|uniref:RNA polymerase II elongation factor ELL N-terminal domain-containing protein n=1 Tax=Trachymyrmex septentrionalis TaxID=34720 RepID=A0A195FKN6_9HYME|nr:hypothetical protein ALC56_04381 [Trachymyrmex septentrionalis]
MGDEEMALVPDVQYGLSSHGNFDERKSLVFVKLTDSSQRAIREYLKIKERAGSTIGPARSQCLLRSLRFKVDRCAHAHTRVHVRVIRAHRSYVYVGR